MLKQEFLDKLRTDLVGLPKQELEERLAFYSEMIDDCIEDGLSEEDAVAGVGSVDEISAQIISDIPFAKIAKERIKPKRRMKAWEIVLLILGSPIWLSLAVAAFVVILSLYVVLWSLIVSVWAILAALAASALGVAFAGIAFAIFNNALVGVAMIGAALVCAGLAIFMFFGCHGATKGIILLTKKLALGVKKCFVRKEKAE